MNVAAERQAILDRLRGELAQRGAGWTGRAVWAPGRAPGPAVVAAEGGALAGALEQAIGGWPESALVAVCGVGRTRVAAAALAREAGIGDARGPVAWVDGNGWLFPPAVARLGVDLARMLWVRPRDVGETLWATHVLLAGGAFARMVVDLGAAGLDRRVERALVRLRRDAERSGASAFLLAEEPVPGAALTLVCEEHADGLCVDWSGRGARRSRVSGAGEPLWPGPRILHRAPHVP